MTNIFQNYWLGQKQKKCAFQVSHPYLDFWPDPKHFVNCEQIIVKYAENREKCSEKCNIYLKYVDKIEW